MSGDNGEFTLCYGCMKRLEDGQMTCPSCGYDNSHIQNNEDVLPEGTILAGKYLVGKMLGRGGFGVTYLGYDLMLERKVAIKEYFPAGVSTRITSNHNVKSISTQAAQDGFFQGRDAFRDEALTLARFNDPSIVHVLDFFLANGTAYIVMEFVTGQELSKAIKQSGGRMAWQRVVELFLPLIKELQVLHEEHLIHRDIKPANIKVVPAEKGIPEHLVLLDFGAARRYVSENVTGTYTAMVTQGYAPIEQYNAQSRQGPYTDVYGICATMYHAVTGQVPPASTAIMMGEASLASFSELGLDVPPAIEKAIRRGMALNSRDRTQNMGQLYSELSAVSPVVRKKTVSREPDEREKIYQNAKEMMSAGTVSGYAEAMGLFGRIAGYKDADRLIEVCRQKIRKAGTERTKSPEEKKPFPVWLLIAAAIVLGCGAIFAGLTGVFTPKANPDVVLPIAVNLTDDLSTRAAMLRQTDQVGREYLQKTQAAQKTATAVIMDAQSAAQQETEAAEATADAAIMETQFAAQRQTEQAINRIATQQVVQATWDALYATQTKMAEPTLTPTRIPPTATPKPLALKVGDTYTFGHYEQDNNLNNGTEAIEWQVLAVENGRALLISRYGLDTKPYNTEWTDVNWETCSLRAWLNGEFYNSAFSSAEHSRIAQVTNSNPDNPDYGTEGGNSTQDCVFLLSIAEANKYFSSNASRQCKATAYAKANGAYVSDSNGYSRWWLRSPGRYHSNAANVSSTGIVFSTYGNNVTLTSYFVRPAFWLNL